MNDFEVNHMKKHELLSPAGNMECLYQAVYNGADAVYISGHSFGARKFATNFSLDEIEKAIKFCHLYGVKLFVTMNTLVKEDEVDNFIEQAKFLHQKGVDALIVQDFGMICLLREKFPNLEIHASTQFNNSSKETCELLYKLGVKRVVFSRELSIDEIDEIKTPIEKEAFIHGALCISYSGRCLMSSMLGGRSGNRGECAGICRTKFSLASNDKIMNREKYLLSTKELNTTSQIDRLLESSIYSFKIEGRMKSPLYVAFITNLYRKLIDHAEINLEEETEKLKIIFNRSFTTGRLFHATDQELMNTSSPNHRGLIIGKVEIKKDKIKIILDQGRKIYQNDAIRFVNQEKGMIINYLYDEKGKLCKEAENICYIDNKVNLTKSDILSKTQSLVLENEYLKKDVYKKIPITFEVEAYQGHNLKISISDKNNKIEAYGEMIEKSITSPTTKETLIEKLSKIGNTPFEVEKIDINKDENIFIQIRQINEIKRNLIEKLIEKRQEPKIEFIEKRIDLIKEDTANKTENGYTCQIQTEEQLLECLKHNFKRIYVSNEKLYEKYKKYQNIVFSTEKCGNHYNQLLKEKNLVNDMFDFSNLKEIYGGYGLNVTNSYTAYYLKKYGLKNIPISCELSELEMNKLLDNYIKKYGNYEFEILSYGRIENMIIKGNILGLSKDDYSFQLLDFKHRKFPVFFDGNKTHILNFERKKNDIKMNYMITRRFDFYEETPLEIKNILKEYGIEK